MTPKPKTKRRPSTAKKPTVTRKASLNRTNSLTDAQKKEKKEIMEILLDYYDYVPHIPIARRPSAIQGNVESTVQLAQGNVVVVSSSDVDLNGDLSGFQQVKSRRTSHKEKKDAKEILNVLVDFKESQHKTVNNNKASIQANKGVKHIQANKSQVRAKLAT